MAARAGFEPTTLRMKGYRINHAPHYTSTVKVFDTVQSNICSNRADAVTQATGLLNNKMTNCGPQLQTLVRDYHGFRPTDDPGLRRDRFGRWPADDNVIGINRTKQPINGQVESCWELVRDVSGVLVG